MDDGFDGEYLDFNGDHVPLYNETNDGGQGTNATYRGENNEGKHAEADDASEGGATFFRTLVMKKNKSEDSKT